MRLPAELEEALRKRATVERVPRSQILRRALYRELEPVLIPPREPHLKSVPA